jgi:hypothetical protein
VSATQASGPHFDCTSDSTGISCAGPLLPAGGDAAFDFVLSTPRSTLSRDITSAAQAFTTTPDPRLGNDRSTTTTHVTGLPAAQAQKLTLGNAVETARSGAITFPVTCLNIDTGYCMTTLTITFKRPHQNLTTIKRKLRLAAGKSVPYISPSRSQRQKIKAIRRLGIRVTLTNPPGTPVSRDSVLSGSARTRR